MFTPSSSNTSFASKPDMGDEAHVKVYVAGRWTDIKVSPQFAKDLLGQGVAKPTTSATDGHAQALTHGANGVVADNSATGTATTGANRNAGAPGSKG
jgi:hypothetical protein